MTDTAAARAGEAGDAQGVVWQGELRDDGCLTRLREYNCPGCGLVQVAEDNAEGPWAACDDPHRVAVLVGALLRDSLAREAELKQQLGELLAKTVTSAEE